MYRMLKPCFYETRLKNLSDVPAVRDLEKTRRHQVWDSQGKSCGLWIIFIISVWLFPLFSRVTSTSVFVSPEELIGQNCLEIICQLGWLN